MWLWKESRKSFVLQQGEFFFFFLFLPVKPVKKITSLTRHLLYLISVLWVYLRIIVNLNETISLICHFWRVFVSKFFLDKLTDSTSCFFPARSSQRDFYFYCLLVTASSRLRSLSAVSRRAGTIWGSVLECSEHKDTDLFRAARWTCTLVFSGVAVLWVWEEICWSESWQWRSLWWLCALAQLS